jgi:hypothetical protein
VGLVVAVPAAQGGVAGVGKQKGQRRQIQRGWLKKHVGLDLLAGKKLFAVFVRL